MSARIRHGGPRALLRAAFVRHETIVDQGSNLKAGFGAILCMAIVGTLAARTGQPLLFAPLGATAVLVFGQPSSPLAQPINLMGGYLIGTIVSELAFFAFPGEMMAASVAVGVSIFLMRWMRVTHPPAGAVPIMGFAGAVHGLQLFSVILASCIITIAIGDVIHRLPPRRLYPLPDDR